MFFSSIVFVYLLFSISYCCEKFPNGTDVKPVWFMCDDVKSDGTVYDIKFHDVKTGKDEYPIKLYQAVDVVMDLSTPDDFPALTLDIDLFSWAGLGGCSWHKVPTFGLLSGLDACKNGVPCPIKKGRHTIITKFDFTKYSKIASLLANNAPYKIRYQLTDPKRKKAICINSEIRVLTRES